MLAVKLLSWRCSAIQLDEVGSVSYSFPTIISTFLLVCRVSSPRIKDRKGIIVEHSVWKSKHAYFSARNLFPIPIKCSISMILFTTISAGIVSINDYGWFTRRH